MNKKMMSKVVALGVMSVMSVSMLASCSLFGKKTETTTTPQKVTVTASEVKPAESGLKDEEKATKDVKKSDVEVSEDETKETDKETKDSKQEVKDQAKKDAEKTTLNEDMVKDVVGTADKQ